MFGGASATHRRGVATAARHGDLVAHQIHCLLVDLRGVGKRIRAWLSACRQGAAERTGAGECTCCGYGAEGQSGAKGVIEDHVVDQPCTRNVHGNGVLDYIVELNAAARDRVRCLVGLHLWQQDNGLRVCRIGRRRAWRFIGRVNLGVHRDRAGIARVNHIGEVERQALVWRQSRRHPGERHVACRRTVVGGRHTGRKCGEVDAGRTGRRICRIANDDPIGDAICCVRPIVSEDKRAEHGIASLHRRRNRDRRAHIDRTRLLRDDDDRVDYLFGLFQRPQVQRLCRAEIFIDAVGAIRIAVGGTRPMAIVFSSTYFGIGIDAQQGVRRLWRDLQMPRATQMTVQLADQRAACGPVTAVIEVNRAVLRTVELDQRRTTILVAFQIDDREMDLAIAPQNAVFVLPHRKRVAHVVHAIPKHGMAAGVGDSGQHAVERRRGVIVNPIAADHDLIGECVDRVEREHTPCGLSGRMAGCVADECRVGQLRYGRNLGNAKCIEDAVDLYSVWSCRRDIVEENGEIRACRLDAGGKARSLIYRDIVATHVAVQGCTVGIQKPGAVGEKCCRVGIRAAENLPVAVTVTGDVVKVVVHAPAGAVGTGTHHPGIGEQPAIDVLQ